MGGYKKGIPSLVSDDPKYQIVLGLFLDSIKEKKIGAWKVNLCYVQRRRTGGYHGRMIDIRDVLHTQMNE